MRILPALLAMALGAAAATNPALPRAAGTPSFATARASAPPTPAAAAAPAASGRAAEPRLPAGINDPYRNPTLDVEGAAAGFGSEYREAFAAREAVVAAMDLREGQRVADIGAGTGIYVPLFARAVGPRGRVYAVDIAEPFLAFIAASARREGLDNVVTLLGGDRSSNLPEGALDAVFHSDAYHHFERPIALTRDHARALKPDGRLWVLDFERIEGVSSDFILRHVRAGKQTVIREIESAGFELVREVQLPELRENYLLEFRKRGPGSHEAR